MDNERKRKHEAAQAAKQAASINVRSRGHIAPSATVAENQIDWAYWLKLPEVKVFEAIALLNGTEPDCEPPDTDDASPEYRKTLRLLLACLSDHSMFTPGTLNICDPALHGVKLAEAGLWALANGFVLPDKFPQPVRISKAPPPITPLSGTSNIAPALPPVTPPNWGKWAYMRDIEIWEAVALTLNLEPDQLPVYLGAFDKLGDDPFRICPTPFLERLLVTNSNCGISLGFKPVHELKARCLVDLPEFAAWAVKLNIPNLPPELLAMADTKVAQNLMPAPEAAPLNDEVKTFAGRELLAAFSETVNNGAPLNWRYWVSQLPTLTTAEAARLMCGLDPDLFKSLESRPNKNDQSNPRKKAAMIQRLAEREGKESATSGEWISWAGEHQIAVHDGFRLEVESEPAKTTATPAPVVTVGASDSVELAKAGPLPLPTGDIAFCFAGLHWKTETEWKKPLGDKPKWLVACIVIPGVRGVSETRWNPVCIGAALVRAGHAKPNSVRAKFQTQPLLKLWLDEWKTYEADNYGSN